MSELIVVDKVNEVHLKVTTDPGVRQEIMQYFSFRPNGYQFVPSYKNKVWDGYIRLYNPMKPVLYIGLLDYLVKFCEDRGYQIKLAEQFDLGEQVDGDYVVQLAKTLNTPFEPRDYQIEYVVNALNSGRSLSLSPTSSGKSFIIYLIQQHYMRQHQLRTLIIVPTVSLVYQLASDFVSYGCDPAFIHKILSGAEKNSKRPIVISTWQSIVKMPADWFSQFGVVLGDEAHNFQAKSLTSIMEKMVDTPYRHGFTGTISSESKVHRMVLEGLFGSIKRFVTTKELMEEGSVADFKIKGIVLNHSLEVTKTFNDAMKEVRNKNKNRAKKINPFNLEKEFLINLEKRNLFIRNLVWSLKDQNNLILFDRVEKHGKVLEPLLRKEGRVLHFIHGGVAGIERDRVRDVIENDNTYTITLHFNGRQITADGEEEIPLTNGSIIKGKNVTQDHDIAEFWIQEKLRAKT
jgi:superfamily II DNA or RNA helicase